MTHLQQTSDTGPDPAELRGILARLSTVRAGVLARASEMQWELRRVPEENRSSAENLAHYIALRSQDLYGIQEVLARFGLSSLGRLESHVMANIDTVLWLLQHVASGSPASLLRPKEWLSGADGREVLRRRTERLLGPVPGERSVRIMVTLSAEAAADYALVRDLLSSGMNCARINCAHDDATAWLRMVEHVRRAEVEVGASCRILMDVPGPRLRTGRLRPGPEVLKVRPPRDEMGRMVRPAEVWLTPAEDPRPPSTPADAALPLPGWFLAELSVGDHLRLVDTRGARRILTVSGASGASRWARLEKTAYVATGSEVEHMRRRPEEPTGAPARACFGPIPARETTLLLRPGDTLVLTRSQEPGRPAVVDATGGVLAPPHIPCTPPEALEWVKVAERIWFNDGRIGGVITAVQPDAATVAITMARPSGDRLGAGKGINLPDTALHFPPLMEQDLEDLPFIARHADLVGYSFVRSSGDVIELQRRLEEMGATGLGIVLKIETRAAYEDLPGILLAALRSPEAGVMIARGDLAVECGFAHLAEVQEEILWMCEAAHLPVIWATQVLEQLAKDGRPSRAEVTDAAMAERAECVMLNKGPYITEAVRALDSILKRMQSHQEKKRPLLRPMEIAERFFAVRGETGDGSSAPGAP